MTPEAAASPGLRLLGPAAACVACASGFVAACRPPVPPPAPAPPRDPLAELLEASSADGLSELPFADVIEAATGNRVVPAAPASPIASAIAGAADAAIAALSAEGSPVRQARRINEASRHFEAHLMATLDALPDFTCTIPPTAGGVAQRSGYPDLRILHHPSGAVAYLDPKLFESGSESSSFRTFYYEPKTGTNKVTEDAHHLLLGIAHDGNDGAWTFLRWHLVDLAGFRVRLKAEFQASNRDLYDSALILRSSQ